MPLTSSQNSLFCRSLKTKKAFQGLMLPERLFELFDGLMGPLGSRLLCDAYHHNHSVLLDRGGWQGGAHKQRRHGVTGQMLMRVFPSTNH
jgi:hypothetical protein